MRCRPLSREQLALCAGDPVSVENPHRRAQLGAAAVFMCAQACRVQVPPEDTAGDAYVPLHCGGTDFGGSGNRVSGGSVAYLGTPVSALRACLLADGDGRRRR